MLRLQCEINVTLRHICRYRNRERSSPCDTRTLLFVNLSGADDYVARGSGETVQDTPVRAAQRALRERRDASYRRRHRFFFFFLIVAPPNRCNELKKTHTRLSLTRCTLFSGATEKQKQTHTGVHSLCTREIPLPTKISVNPPRSILAATGPQEVGVAIIATVSYLGETREAA